MDSLQKIKGIRILSISDQKKLTGGVDCDACTYCISIGCAHVKCAFACSGACVNC